MIAQAGAILIKRGVRPAKRTEKYQNKFNLILNYLLIWFHSDDDQIK